MNAVMSLPAHADGWTVEDLEGLPDDELRYELVDGGLQVSPLPTNMHDYTVTRLAFLLEAARKPSWRILAGGGIRFDSRNYRGPDVMMIHDRALRSRMAAPADVLLAVEVMSPSSVTNDRLVKPAQYAAAGIPHYWRLELSEIPVLVTHELAGDVYREAGRFTDEVVVEEPVRVSFRIPDLLA